MMGDETNENVLDSNMSKGHGHQSSPSHPPLGRGDGGVRHDTRVPVHYAKHIQKRKPTHTPRAMTSAGAEGAGKVTNRLSSCVDADPRASARLPTSPHHPYTR